MAKTLSELAAEAGSYMTTTERGEDRIVVLKDERPEWVFELVHHAHGGDFLPDDWRYATVAAALEWIADAAGEESTDADDAAHEFADQNVDVYNSARLEWLSSNLYRAGYCDEAAESIGAEEFGIYERIGLGQYQESREVFELVIGSLEERAEELEEEEEATTGAGQGKGETA